MNMFCRREIYCYNNYMDTELPKLKATDPKDKITIYFDKEVADLYRTGKYNGWDVSEIVRRASTEALKKFADKLLEKAG